MRPLTVGELLDATFGAVRRNLGTLALCTLVATAPVAVLRTLVTAATTEDAFDFGTTAVIEEDELGAYIAGNLGVGLLTLVASMLATAACLRAVAGDVLGIRATAGESLRFAAARLGPLLLASLLYALAILGGVLALVVGAIWVWVLFCLYIPALLFEDRRGTAALARSRDLIRDHWWRTFGALLILALIAGVLGALAAGITGALLSESEDDVVNAVALTLAGIAANAFALPLTAALTTYIYLDLRVRKEGFDVARLTERLGAAAPQPSGLPADPGVGGFLPPRPPGG
jgi:hypothetical protein